MIPFEHTGPDWPALRWVRTILVGAFLLVGAILLFPFTLLALFLRALGYLANPRREPG
jgi:hypothetical protein